MNIRPQVQQAIETYNSEGEHRMGKVAIIPVLGGRATIVMPEHPGTGNARVKAGEQIRWIGLYLAEQYGLNVEHLQGHIIRVSSQ